MLITLQLLISALAALWLLGLSYMLRAAGPLLWVMFCTTFGKYTPLIVLVLGVVACPVAGYWFLREAATGVEGAFGKGFVEGTVDQITRINPAQREAAIRAAMRCGVYV